MSTTAPDSGADGSDAPDISLVIPTLNEEGGIRTCIERARRGFEQAGLSGEIIVSDSSSDRTPEIAEEMGARVVTPDKPGYGYAYLYAFSYVRGDIIVIGDGDTTYDFAELPKFIAQIEDGADLVIGSRFAGEIRPGAMPKLHRYVGNPLLTKFLNVFYQMDISDAHSGFRVFTRDALESMDLDARGMEFASEMLVRSKVAGLDVREVPITYHERQGEAKIESFADGWRHVRFLVINAPGESFLIPGFTFLIAGFLLMGITLFDVPPVEFLSVNSMTAGSILAIIGSNVIALGIFSTIAGNPIRNLMGSVPTLVVTNFSVERGIGTGITVFLGASAYASYLIGVWIASGFEAVPSPSVGILTMTFMAIGLQTVFQMLFLSLILDSQG